METIIGRELQVVDATYACQFDGKGGCTPIDNEETATSEKPCWLHLDYQHPASIDWISTTAVLPQLVREPLSGASTRPRVNRLSEGMMLTLRGINLDSDSRPDQLVTVRIYLTDKLIVSTCHRKFYAIEAVMSDLYNHSGASCTAQWLVEMIDALTDQVIEFIEQLHDQIIDLEDALLEQLIPERGQLALIRKQLIVLRRYMAPQRDVFSRLAIERLAWITDEQRYRLQALADRLGRGLDDVDGSIARTAILADEITVLMADAMNRRTYTMSIMAMIFLPTTFLTGLFGVNLGGIPGNASPVAFATFCVLLLLLIAIVAWWLRRSRWL
ncbi:zinc transporter ZntB [Serratia microhaemolytica]|uniref:zinc transporter ZntB n=1 Tax=Serratia microhaemolytica TaxID=2675110 RepID=UPI000FDEDE6A|nr:zinc transporter ZntB [Serratia microhaemolytica]